MSFPPPPPPPPPPPGFQGSGSGESSRGDWKPLASLLLGIFGICGVTAIVGLILGVVALGAGAQGGKRTMAIVGIVTSALWLVLLIYLSIA